MMYICALFTIEHFRKINILLQGSLKKLYLAIV